MTGGSGEDRFVFRLASDAPATGPGYDEILDFVRSDKIDLRAIDANAGASGNQAFRFIAGQPLSGPAQLNVQAFEGDLLVTGSTNADAAAAFAFVVRTDLASLRAADFVL
jgi:Ca2+-binding RTX toxin-like protein